MEQGVNELEKLLHRFQGMSIPEYRALYLEAMRKAEQSLLEDQVQTTMAQETVIEYVKSIPWLQSKPLPLEYEHQPQDNKVPLNLYSVA